MFRGCYFEYAGKSSNDYNLQLYYYNRSEDMLDTGGKYELKTDVLPKSTEQYLYGLNHSNTPIEFDIEIINPDREIPIDQMIEIKNWLFGQDGWKTFRTYDELQDYHLKCVLMPESDIIDGLGYRGFKCTLRNASPFWYGQPKSIHIDKGCLNANIQQGQYGSDWISYWAPFEITIDDNIGFADSDIFPDIQVAVNTTVDEEGEELINNEVFEIGVTKYATIQELVDSHKGTYPNSYNSDVTSLIEFNFGYKISNPQIWNISTKYLTIDRGSSANSRDKISVGNRGLRLSQGKNICYVTVPTIVSDLVFTYTPCYRLGVF